MGILTRDEIVKTILEKQLIIDAHQINGEYDVEPASYDLRSGVIIWKEFDNVNRRSIIQRLDFDSSLPIEKQPSVTIQPGQVMFVITKEQVNLPVELCGTVYAKNEFSREGILLFTTGHIDPGVKCPIVIRLVNLRSTPYVLMLGQPIYTIVFQKVASFPGGALIAHAERSMEQTIIRTLKSAEEALDNTLYDLSLLNNLVKRDEFSSLARENTFIRQEDFGRALWRWSRRHFIKVFFILIGIITFLAAVVSAIPSGLELLKEWGKSDKTKEQKTQPSANPGKGDSINNRQSH